MKKQVYVINERGFIVEIHIAEFDEEGNPLEELADNKIPINPPDGLYRVRWTGTEWVEDMPQSEIDELNKPIDSPPTDTEILGQQMTEREIEAMTQGQQITDIELRMMIYEMGAV